jgi:hypothetical protein
MERSGVANHTTRADPPAVTAHAARERLRVELRRLERRVVREVEELASRLSPPLSDDHGSRRTQLCRRRVHQARDEALDESADR